MLTRRELEDREDTSLAPYAVRSRGASRHYPETESESRTAFQKDRDRVLHTTAFRRLDAKTQVFTNPQGDHFRTRLTHTLEVQQVARSVALNLGLNETLAETVALAHDLGHPPFGHAGERLLNRLMEGAGGFDHNSQAQRIVTVLEQRYPDFPGLNLTLETLDGLNKHQREQLRPTGRGQPSLEAQVVDAADALAYTAHDLDDGLRSGLLTPDQLRELPLWQELLARLGLRGPLTSMQVRMLQRELLGWLITDLTTATDEAIRVHGPRSAAEVQALPERLVRYSPHVSALMQEARAFLYANLYRHWRREMQIEQSNAVLERLFETYTRRPELLPPAPLARAGEDGLPRAICDHVAGMTDRYALETYAQLVPPTSPLAGGWPRYG